MRAIVFDRFGPADVLREARVDTPSPGPGQVRVRVRAAGVNPLDGKIRAGFMEALFPTPLPAIPGIELAGIVDAVAADVTAFKPGDEVLGWSATGAYADYALADAAALAPKPAALGWAHAAALPVASETAERVLDELRVAAGETVLIHGAAGAVGTLAVQLAAARDARVIGTAGVGNQPYLASLGASPVVYGDGLVDRVRALAPDGVDAVFDVAGKGALEDSIVLRGGTTDRIVTIADLRARESGVAFSASPPRPTAARLGEHARQAAAGRLTTTVGAEYPLAEAAAVAEAQRVSDSGHSRGKLVLTAA